MWDHELDQIVTGICKPPADWPRHQEEWELQHERYIMPLQLWPRTFQLLSAEELLPAEEQGRQQVLQLLKDDPLVVSPFMYGNSTALANDPSPDPYSHLRR
jgi:hypothetical protein